MTGEELRQWVTDNGFPAFRAVQIGDWLGKGVTNFDEMRNLPADLKKKLQTSCYISVATIAKKQVSRYDKTVKYLFSFHDGECVEAVLMSGGLQDGLHLLRNGQKRLFAEPDRL